MGARKIGDIGELCALVRPQYGILNIVGSQHLATFKTVENVMRAKYELIEGLTAPALAVFNCDGENTAALYGRYGGPKIASCRFESAGKYRNAVSYKDAEISPCGSSFTLVCGGESARCTSALLGGHNISNLCAAAARALALGVSPAEIAEAIRGIGPGPHRLELLRTAGGVTVIDDAYNSNPEGFRAAVGALSAFTGGRRILITPGFAEMGKRTHEENRRAGACAAGGADMLLALGRGGADLRAGWLSGGGAESGVLTLPDLDAAKKWLTENVRAEDTVLFENDIPDF
jgi:UDP-N-acetylmuramoyl-tripeptide--D-alanyl-D-alanine ligase